MASNGGYQDVMEVAWVGCGGSQSQGVRGYALVMCKACGGRPRAGVWSAGHQRVGCGQPSKRGECDKTVQPWVGQHRGRIMQVGRAGVAPQVGCHRAAWGHQSARGVSV